MKAQQTTSSRVRVEIQKETIHLVTNVEEKAIRHTNAGTYQMQSALSAINLDMKLRHVKANFKNKKHNVHVPNQDEDFCGNIFFNL